MKVENIKQEIYETYKTLKKGYVGKEGIEEHKLTSEVSGMLKELKKEQHTRQTIKWRAKGY